MAWHATRATVSLAFCLAIVGASVSGCSNNADEPGGAFADDVCGTAGNQDSARSRSVVAVATPLGRVGCDEALAVADTYLTQPRKTHLATIDDWECKGQRDDEILNICTRDGLVIAMRTPRR